jgi:hypothetical protein
MAVRDRFITTNSSISALSWQSELDLLPLTVVFQLYHGSQELNLLPLTVVFQLYHGSQS